MYLSRVSYNYRRKLGWVCAKSQLDGGSYKSHQQIWQLFSSEDKDLNTKKSPFLFREDYETINGVRKKFFLVLSKEAPKCLKDKNNRLHEIFDVKTKEFNPVLKKGMKLAFSLEVNATISTKKPTDKRGVRHDIIMHAKQKLKEEKINVKDIDLNEHIENVAISWLTDKKRCENWGISFHVTPIVKGWKSEKTSSHKNKISYSWIDYEGILVVEDPVKFLKVMEDGVGRSKAFGCGLFLIKKV